MADVSYPSGIAKPTRNGYDINHVSPLVRSDLVSGRARQRRAFTSVPSIVDMQWFFNDEDASIFEDWFITELNDGAEWFNLDLKTPNGMVSHECRFVGMYNGPRLVGASNWIITAQLETRNRTAQNLTTILYSIVDIATNREWPLA